jgi:hypothetical protein
MDKPKWFARIGGSYAAVGGTILLTLFCNALWDALAKPGLNWLSRVLLGVFTLGSSTVRDLPYSIASLNPYPLPSLLLLICVAYFPVWFLGFMLGKWNVTRSVAKMRSLNNNNSEEASKALTSMLHRRKRIAAVALLVLLLPLMPFFFIGVSVLTEAISIRRIHDANMDIVAPYVKPEDRLKLQSAFAMMTTKAEHVALMSRLKAIASTNGIHLRPESY